MYRSTSLTQLPEVVKNLLIINGLFFLATISLKNYGIDVKQTLALHQFQSTDFMPYQLITHLFMHNNFPHLLSNMFALWMFGKILEGVWGGKKFLIFYLITGLGAALIYIGYMQFQIYEISNLNPDFLEAAKNKKAFLKNEFSFIPESEKLTNLVNTPMLGASGAVFGILLAFGMLFPNTLLYIYFAIPIKAKYFVMIYGALELYLGLSNRPSDNIAHFAHLGGMIFGFILLKYWKKNRNTFY